MQHITSDILYIGSSEGHTPLFENIYPVPNGMSYNAYLIDDEQTVLTDTCDVRVRDAFWDNLTTALAGRTLDYLLVHHVEPDHAALVAEVVDRYPTVRVVCTAKARDMLAQFTGRDFSDRTQTVREGDTLTTGRHTFAFYTAPMVHWPEVMVSYDTTDKVLFSADAFGTFGELNGDIFADTRSLDGDWLDEARRYYANIVGKYGVQVQALLKKAAGLDIQVICPLHGPIWRQDLAYLLDKYNRWSTYTPESNGVVMFYGSIYGHTERFVRDLAVDLAERDITDVRLYDVAKTHPSVAVAEAFRCRNLVVAAVSYNAGLFPPMETVLADLRAHGLRQRNLALIQNGSWAPSAGRVMTDILTGLNDITYYEPMITLKSAPTPDQTAERHALADWLALQAQ